MYVSNIYIYIGDPHPGNFFYRPHDGKICLLDFGQVKEIDKETRIKFAKLVQLLRADVNYTNDREVANGMRAIGFGSKK